MINDVFVVDALRTPIGKFRGSLASFALEELLSPLIVQLLKRNSLASDTVDEVIVGNAAGAGGNPARLALLQAGLPVSVPGFTVDRQCGSGLEAINTGIRMIQSGAANLVIAGGAESSSTAPRRANVVRHANDVDELTFYERARFSPSVIGDPDMGFSADLVARRYNITRQQQDKFALRSHQATIAAETSGVLRAERLGIGRSPTGSPGSMVDYDECPRSDTCLEALASLSPVFGKDGTVTAGNACPINDGAALVLLSSQPKSAGRMLKFLGACARGVDPNYLGIGPVPAVKALLKQLSLSMSDIDRIEFNEAFAAQVLACMDLLALDPSRLNPDGGALALGHPYGASGAMLVTRLYHQLETGERGLATLGIGGGMGLASLFEGVESSVE